MESSPGKAMLDSVMRQAKRKQLRSGHDPMLRPGKRPCAGRAGRSL